MPELISLVGITGQYVDLLSQSSSRVLGVFRLACPEVRADETGQWQDFVSWHEILVYDQRLARSLCKLERGTLVLVYGRPGEPEAPFCKLPRRRTVEASSVVVLRQPLMKTESSVQGLALASGGEYAE